MAQMRELYLLITVLFQLLGKPSARRTADTIDLGMKPSVRGDHGMSFVTSFENALSLPSLSTAVTAK